LVAEITAAEPDDPAGAGIVAEDEFEARGTGTGVIAHLFYLAGDGNFAPDIDFTHKCERGYEFMITGVILQQVGDGINTEVGELFGPSGADPSQKLDGHRQRYGAGLMRIYGSLISILHDLRVVVFRGVFRFGAGTPDNFVEK